MSVIGGVITAICSLTRCFPAGVNIDTTLKGNYLHTFDVDLAYPGQKINVALDLSSSNFWVFGNSTVSESLEKQFKSGVFDLSETEHIFIPEKPIFQTANYTQWTYEDNFQVELEQVRTTVKLGGVSFGIPYIGVNKHFDELTAYMVRSSGMFGIQRNMYSNSIMMQANYDSILTLYTPTSSQVKGRLTTGNVSIPQCKAKFVYYNLFGSNVNRTSYFSFTSQKQNNSQMLISTTTSFITVDPTTFQMLQKTLDPILDRKKKARKNRPNRRHHLVECSSIKKAPTLEIGNSSIGLLKLEGKDYIRRTRSGYCIFKVREQRSDDSRWVLSYPFLRKYCMQIDLYKQQIGFALAQH